jgi:hypothetical protein
MVAPLANVVGLPPRCLPEETAQLTLCLGAASLLTSLHNCWRVERSTLVGLVAGGTTAAGMSTLMHDDTGLADGLVRSATFWSQAFPIFLHYKATEMRVKGLPDDQQTAAYAPLHDRCVASALQKNSERWRSPRRALSGCGLTCGQRIQSQQPLRCVKMGVGG